MGVSDELKPRKISVADYEKMVEAGVLRAGERIELLDGVIVQMSVETWRNASVHGRIMRYLFAMLDDRASICGQLTFPLGDIDEPRPDIGIFLRDENDWFIRAPRLQETYALIEIAGTMSDTEIGPKRDLYARFGVKEYLISDVESRILKRYTEPKDGHYDGLEHLRYGQTFSLMAFPDVKLDVEQLLPPPFRRKS